MAFKLVVLTVEAGIHAQRCTLASEPSRP
jgi:hypothetical protein